MKMQCNQDVIDRLRTIQDDVAEMAIRSNRKANDINIMAVTKTVHPQLVNIAIENGIKLIGENRVQEFLEKKDAYNIKKQDIHFIGHLQTNKVKYIIDSVSMIESVSSLKLAKEIDKQANKNNLKIDILLELNIANEQSKHGFLIEEFSESIHQVSQLENVTIKGIMCIPPKENTEFYFDKMSSLYAELRASGRYSDICYLSMGMSGDYKKAILHNSNIIRLGSAIFGKRNVGGYNNEFSG